MKLHVLKIKSTYFDKVNSGIKTFEIRKNDRDYQVGDYVHFVEINGEEFENNEKNLFEIIYVLKDIQEYGLDKEYCIFSIKRVIITDRFYEVKM